MALCSWSDSVLLLADKAPRAAGLELNVGIEQGQPRSEQLEMIENAILNLPTGA